MLESSPRIKYHHVSLATATSSIAATCTTNLSFTHRHALDRVSSFSSFPPTYSLFLAQHAPRFLFRVFLNCVRPRGWASFVLTPHLLVLSCPSSLRFSSLVLAYSFLQQYHFVEVGSGPFERSLGSTILHRLLGLSKFSDLIQIILTKFNITQREC